jgi:long-chain acyl-CoA synthetase
MLTVPLLIEKVYRNGIGPKLRGNSLYRFPPTRQLAIRVAGRKLKSAFGGKMRFFGVGGAPLAAEVEQFLRDARFPYAMGYGLTEAAPLLAGGTPFTYPYRSTGALLPSVELRIAAAEKDTDSASSRCGANAEAGVGEIQARGPNVMMGYYRNEEQTREAFTDDGWLRTGDLGRIDNDSKLFICGRSKFLILGPGGENIYPEEIEGLLGSSPLVEDALVYPGASGEIAAMVKLTDAAKAAADNLEHSLEELRTWANKKLANFSRLSKIIIRHDPFEKTPTMKIKRHLYV